MYKLVLLPFIYFVYHVTVTEVSAIQCWKCDSVFDPACMDPFDNRTAHSQNCNDLPDLPHMPGVKASMCRKTRQKIYGKWRIKRDCARLGEPGIGGDERYCIFRSGTYNIHSEYCTCNAKDKCNGAPGSGEPSALVLWCGLLTAVLTSLQHLTKQRTAS